MNLRRAFAGVLLLAGIARAENGSLPVGEPVLERPTLHSLGVYWIVRGDENRNAAVSLAIRRAGEGQWHPVLPLFRVEKGADRMEKFGTTVPVSEDSWLFAGSAVLLEPDAEYELRLDLADPDGGEAHRVLRQRTKKEPALPAGAVFKHVVPGSGGGTGSAAEPFRGLAAAQKGARPGDRFLLEPGRYEGTFEVKASGTAEEPIVWRGSEQGEVILDAQGTAAKRPGRAISATGVHDIWFENLSIVNADYGIVAHDSARIVVRRCHIFRCDYGIAATRDTGRGMDDFFIADNLIEGPCTWPRSKGIEDPRGIQITGAGHDVCYNRIRGFADAIDTMPSARCSAIDFHHNDCSECTDDGIEMDYSQRNTRCFENRLTNIFQGISVQPVYGGPVYLFRNALYNVGMEPFKMHNSPSGVLVYHNTVVKKGPPLLIYTGQKVRNCVYRNNLFLGSDGKYAYEASPPMVECDFDYDGFGGGPFDQFLKWNNQRYRTFEEMRAKAPVYQHATWVDAAAAFASGARVPGDVARQYPAPDLRLSTRSQAVDAGQKLAGFNDAFRGAGPDLGAYEAGEPMPHYGPRAR